MEIEKIESIIESILFAAGRIVAIEEMQMALEIAKEDLESTKQRNRTYKNKQWISAM